MKQCNCYQAGTKLELLPVEDAAIGPEPSTVGNHSDDAGDANPLVLKNRNPVFQQSYKHTRC